MEELIKELLLTKSWKFAKSMPTTPHEYTLEKNWYSKKAYKIVEDFINKNGKKEKFFRTYFTYYYLDGHKYWCCDIGSEGGIINRCKKDKNY